MPNTPWQVKNIPMELRRRLKAAAVLKGITIGQALCEAIEMWLKKQDKQSS